MFCNYLLGMGELNDSTGRISICTMISLQIPSIKSLAKWFLSLLTYVPIQFFSLIQYSFAPVTLVCCQRYDLRNACHKNLYSATYFLLSQPYEKQKRSQQFPIVPKPLCSSNRSITALSSKDQDPEYSTSEQWLSHLI